MATPCALVAATLMALVPSALGHGWLMEPPARNAVSGPRNGYCPHCGNGGGVCGDGGQWPQSSNYLGGENAGVQRTYTSGEAVEFVVKITAHHKGHFELHLCDEHLGPLTQDPEGPNGCLNKWVLERVDPKETYGDCVVDDSRGDCQPLDEDHPERWYLPPSSGEHKMVFRIPSGMHCEACTLQWRWWTANSCTPAEGYGCYFSRISALGWNGAAWCGSFCGGGCPRSNSLRGHQQAGAESHRGCGEEFRNCADIKILASGPTTAPPATTAAPVTTVAPATTAAPVTTAAPTTTFPMSEATTTARSPSGNCVSQEVLTCINDYSTFWPKCDPSQSKNNAGPSGYEFGHYCTQEWTDALNAVLSHHVVDKCGDSEAIQKFLAQVTYETGYFSTVYQPRDGGAGLIHMIPGNWQVNAGDMDSLWPGNDFQSTAASMGKNFFQTPEYGWRSVAAWFILTNGVIGGCGKNLFDESFDEQTRCILSRVVSRQEAFDVVGRCMAQHPPVVETTPAPSSATTTPSPATTTPVMTTTSMPPTTTPVMTTTAVPPTTTAPPTTAAPTTAAPMPTAPPTQGSACVQNIDCSANPWCNDPSHKTWCATNGASGWCPSPQCRMASKDPLAEPEPEPEPEPSSATTTPSPATTTPVMTTTPTMPPTTAAPTTAAPTTVAPPTTAAPTPTAPPTQGCACVQNTDCSANPWCNDPSHKTWCATNGASGWCPSPQCRTAC